MGVRAFCIARLNKVTRDLVASAPAQQGGGFFFSPPAPGFFLFPPLAVEFFMHLAEVFVSYVRVDLRSGYVGVAKERLHRAEVGAVFEQVGGKAMAYHVGRDLARDAGFDCVALNNPFYRAWSETQFVGAF